MADSIEHIELLEIAPQTPHSEILHDAINVQEHAVDTQQSDGDPPSASTTQSPVANKEPYGDASVTSKLWHSAIVFGKNITMADILTFCAFPLLILGAWAAIKTVQLAEWTQVKDILEYCENHDNKPEDCKSYQNSNLITRSGPLAMERFVIIPSIEVLNNAFNTEPGIPELIILTSTIYLLLVILVHVFQQLSKSRTASGSARTGSSGYPNINTLDRLFLLSKLSCLEKELDIVRANAADAVEEQSRLRTQLVATNAQNAASLAELNGRLTTLKSELKKSFAEVRTETKEIRETVLSGLNDSQKIGVSTALGNDDAQDVQYNERSESHIHNKGIRKRLSDIREREHSGLLW